MEKILTIIIAAYNMQDYLKQCCNSLLIPDNFDLLEVLIINDGSTDNTSEIAHGFEQDYPDVFRAIDKRNGNYGSCINRGLREAKGTFIKILDADDKYGTDNFNRLVNSLLDLETRNKGAVDLIITDACKVNMDGQVLSTKKFKLPNNEICHFNQLDYKKILNMTQTSVTYRTEMLRMFEYKQLEGISYTDQMLVRLPLLAVNSFIYYPMTVYKYTIGRLGQTIEHSTFIKNAWMQIEIQIEMCKAFEEKKDKYPIVNQECLRNLLVGENLKAIYSIYLLANNDGQNADEIIELDAFLKNECHHLYNATNEVVLAKWFPVKFIKCWRKDFGNNWQYRLIHIIYLSARKLYRQFTKLSKHNSFHRRKSVAVL